MLQSFKKLRRVPHIYKKRFYFQDQNVKSYLLNFQTYSDVLKLHCGFYNKNFWLDSSAFKWGNKILFSLKIYSLFHSCQWNFHNILYQHQILFKETTSFFFFFFFFCDLRIIWKWNIKLCKTVSQNCLFVCLFVLVYPEKALLCRIKQKHPSKTGNALAIFRRFSINIRQLCWRGFKN